MKYKLLAADMDGTLLNDEGILTERTEAAILSAIQKGVLFVPSTGRPMLAMSGFRSRFPGDTPFILFNGAMAVTDITKKVLFLKNLAFDSVKEIFNLGVKRGVPVILWAGERLMVSRDCEAARKYQSISGADMEVVEDPGSVSEQDIVKMLWIAPPQDAVRYQEEMNLHFNGSVNCHTSRPYLLEFVDKDASKGRALEEIGNIYGIERHEMIAVGDGNNDVSMLEYAGLGVAMQNASGDIKKICQAVAPSNNNDGVAQVIEDYILSERDEAQ